MRKINVPLVILVFAVMGASATKSRAQIKPSAATPIGRDISGFWELSFDSRTVPPAELVPGLTKALIEEQAGRDVHAIRWCNLLGTPFIMDPGRPIDIRQGAREVIITAETNASPRHLYLDRPTHISSDIFDATTNGDSIAHWEGETLVVDTIGFDGKKGISEIPGGGFRTSNSHLIERYRLLENGTVLSVVFTWEDAKIFRVAHTYEFRYHRLPKAYEPSPTISCDPYDEVRAKFLEDVTAISEPVPGRQQ
jgi:hypothetical protein